MFYLWFLYFRRSIFLSPFIFSSFASPIYSSYSPLLSFTFSYLPSAFFPFLHVFISFPTFLPTSLSTPLPLLPILPFPHLSLPISVPSFTSLHLSSPSLTSLHLSFSSSMYLYHFIFLTQCIYTSLASHSSLPSPLVSLSLTSPHLP